jgi:hypothetical protein
VKSELDDAAKTKITEVLLFCWKTLHLYGKKPEDFQSVSAMYLNFLKDYPAEKIIKAFEKYVKIKSEFPTPADIIAIIEGRIKRDSVYYQKLLDKQRSRGFLLNHEQTYISKYESQLHEEW